MVEKIDTLVCIIGAGPAGAAASLTLCKLGIAHVLVDAAVFPRDKVCGDGIDLKSIRVLNNIDPSIVENEIPANKAFSPSMGVRFILHKGKIADLPAKSKNNDLINKPIFYICRRAYFDKFLLDKIDRNIADVRLGLKIENIVKEKDHWILQGKNAAGNVEITAKMLVGADGDHSTVLKYVGERKVDRRYYAPGLRQYWKGVEGIHPEKLIEVYFPPKLPFAYFWIFPMADNEVNVGMGMMGHYVAKKNINLRDALKELIKEDAYLRPRFKNAAPLETAKGWGIPMSTLQRVSHGDRWLLVGDAASIVDPNSGEGIGNGMMSGYIAAYFIKRGIEQNSFAENMFETYDREIHKSLKHEEFLHGIANKLTPYLYSKGVNALLSSRMYQKWFSQKAMPGWLVTAYKKTIQVNFK